MLRHLLGHAYIQRPDAPLELATQHNPSVEPLLNHGIGSFAEIAERSTSALDVAGLRGSKSERLSSLFNRSRMSAIQSLVAIEGRACSCKDEEPTADRGSTGWKQPNH
jgi:hypothetical protein